MIATAKLLEAPTNRDGVRVAEAVLSPGGQKIHVRIMPAAGGVFYPYARGNTVLVALAHGDPDAGAYVIGRFTTPPASRRAGNIEFHAAGGFDLILVARSGDARVVSESGAVYLGAEDAGTGDPQKIALIDKLREDLDSLQAQLDLVVYYLNTAANGGGLLAPGVGATLGAWQALIAAGAVTGYLPNGPQAPDKNKAPTVEGAHNVYAKAEDLLP